MIFLNSIGINKFTLNIFFTLILGLLCITIYDKSKNKSLGILLVLLLMILSELLKCDYGYYGIALTFLFYLFKNKKSYMNISVISTIFIKYTIDFINKPHIFQLYLACGTILSLLFINLYNNKKGKNIKYLLYIFYPLHLIILSILKIFILN